MMDPRDPSTWPDPIDGMKQGCYDQSRSKEHSEDELSRLYDRLIEVGRASGKEAALEEFRRHPDSLKLAFNYSKWTYRARRDDGQA